MPALKYLIASLILSVTLIPDNTVAQVGGSLVAFPPEEIYLDILEDELGRPTFSLAEIKLVTGEYYRLNIFSNGQTDWRLEMDELLQNSHLRVVSINGIEVHLQAMVFRAIEFDEPGMVRISFTPLNPGTYPFTVGRNPIAQGLPRGTANIQEADRRAEGRFIVE